MVTPLSVNNQVLASGPAWLGRALLLSLLSALGCGSRVLSTDSLSDLVLELLL